jgi:hypothetical protein
VGARAKPFDDLAHRGDIGDHPDALAGVDRRYSAIIGCDRGGEFGFSVGVFGQCVLMSGPAGDEVVAQHA